MNKNNHTLIAVLIALSLIAGFYTNFDSPDPNKPVAQGEGVTTKFDSATQLAQGSTVNRTITNNLTNNAQFPIDKSQFVKAPEFTETNGYINTAPIKLADLRGKVVLVDFWTYTCINWIRTIPYLIDWNEKYANKGLVIVGVHTPEFEFEKNIDNVKAAVDEFGLRYPIVQDNDKGTWNAYENRYWPRIYLVDSEGYIRYDHIGEGGYAETEKVIESLLQERAAQMGKDANLPKFDIANTTAIPKGVQSVDFSKIKTPELYFGYQFARAPLGNTEGHKANQIVSYTLPPSDIKSNIIYLEGKWKNNAEYMELESETGRVALVYSAKSVNINAGGDGGDEISVSVSEDGKLLSGASLGQDLSEEGKFVIDGPRLYTLSRHDGYSNHSLILDVKGKGFQAYAFSFG
ncbi:MAG: redoxin domain-containing protein [Nitrososphaeraceae archaeon]